MEDYFAGTEDDHVCSMDAEPPKYFYYKGQTFQIDFTKLDAVHAQVMELKAQTGLETRDAVTLFHEIGLDHFTPSQEDLDQIKSLKEVESNIHTEEETSGPFGLKRVNQLMDDLQNEDFIWGLASNGLSVLKAPHERDEFKESVQQEAAWKEYLEQERAS